MLNAMTGLLLESWNVLCEAAPFMLFGFLVAGMLKAFVPDSLLTRHLGGKSFGSVFKAALIGVPLPLCSCGVLPAAMGLRKQGAGAGATTAFMISTPESGVDSIAVTYAMIDPIMTVLRPVAALLTGIVAGVAANLLPERLIPAMRAETQVPAGCGCGGQCSTTHAAGTHAAGTHSADMHATVAHSAVSKPSFSRRVHIGLDHAFGEILADVGKWLIVGILVAGAISSFMPQEFFLNYLGNEFVSMLAMMLVGVPMYVCASSSTPIAASLLLKGLSPGAALVFLLTGPATNATTITAMAKTFGMALTGVYVGAIVVCSLVFGLLANRLYEALGFNIHAVLGTVNEALPAWFGFTSAVLLLLLLARAMLHHSHEH